MARIRPGPPTISSVDPHLFYRSFVLGSPEAGKVVPRIPDGRIAAPFVFEKRQAADALVKLPSDAVLLEGVNAHRARSAGSKLTHRLGNQSFSYPAPGMSWHYVQAADLGVELRKLGWPALYGKSNGRFPVIDGYEKYDLRIESIAESAHSIAYVQGIQFFCRNDSLVSPSPAGDHDLRQGGSVFHDGRPNSHPKKRTPSRTRLEDRCL
jgi:hypothetical protein